MERQLKTPLVCLGPAGVQIMPGLLWRPLTILANTPSLASGLYLWSGSGSRIVSRDHYALATSIVADFKAGNGSRLNQRLIEGKTPSLNLFLEPLGSGLPYLETTTEEKFVATDMTMEAHRVTLLMLEARRVVTMPQSGHGGSVKYESLQGFEILDFQ